MSVHNNIVQNITVGHHENLLEDHAEKPELVCSGEHEAFSNTVPVRCSPPIVLKPLKPSHYQVFHGPEGNYLYIDRGVELQVAVPHPGPGQDCAVTMRFESKLHQKIPVQTNCSKHLPPTPADNNMVDLRTPHKAAFVLLVGDDRQVHPNFVDMHPVTTVALNAGAAKDVFSIVFPCYSSCESFWKYGKLTVLHLNICHPKTGYIVSSSKYTVRVAANVMARALMMYQKEMLKTWVSAREQQIVPANDGRHDNTGKTVAVIGQQGDDGRDNAGQPSAKRRKQDHTSEEDEEEISLITDFLQGFPTAERDTLIRMSTPPENNGNLITGSADLTDTSDGVNEFQAEWNKNSDPIKIQMGNSTLYTDNKLVGAVGSSSHQLVNNPNTMAGPVGSSSHQLVNNPNTMVGPMGSSSHQVENNPNTMAGPVGSSSHQLENNPNTMVGPMGSSSHQVENNPNTMVGPMESSSHQVENNPNTMVGPVGSSSHQVENNPNTMAGPVGSSSHQVENNLNTVTTVVSSSHQLENNPNSSGQRFIVSDEIVFVVKGLQNREEDCRLIEQFIKSRGASCFQSPLIKPVLD